MKVSHILVEPALRGLSAFDDHSVSAAPGYDPAILRGDSDDAFPDSRWIVVRSGSLILNSPEGLITSMAPGTTAITAPGCLARSDEEFFTLRVPGYRGGTVIASRLPDGPVEGNNAVAYRPVLGADHFGHSVLRMFLRNDAPLHVQTDETVTAMLLLRGAAMAFSCKPGEAELIPDFTRFLIDQRIEPEKLAEVAIADFDGRMQDALDSRLSRAYGSPLNPRPAIGDPDSGLNHAQPLLAGSLLVAYPGDLLYLSSVATWGQTEFVVMQARLPL